MKGMRTWAIPLAACLFGWLALPAVADDVKVGDPGQKVRETLGAPKGYIGCGAYELYVYDRGRVEVNGGKVTSVNLVSEEIARVQQLERERAAAEQTRIQQERRAKNQAEGEQIKAMKLADPVFLAAPAAEQVAFWASFRQQYPGVDVQAVYAAALARQQRDLEQAAVQQRIARLEVQVANAQADAQAAQMATASAQCSWPYATYWSVPWVVTSCRLPDVRTRFGCGARFGEAGRPRGGRICGPGPFTHPLAVGTGTRAGVHGWH